MKNLNTKPNNGFVNKFDKFVARGMKRIGYSIAAAAVATLAVLFLEPLIRSAGQK